MPVEPIEKFRAWMREAAEAGVELSEAVALATADARGRPSVRYVLLKDVGEDGFVFYTNAQSAKGRQLAANPNAALAVYWHATGKQARVEGRVHPVSNEEADAYWRERPWVSQVASLASKQSKPMERRDDLLREFRRLEKEYRDREVPRPKRWRGYRIEPRLIEFWVREEPRLHHRELFKRSGRTWKRVLLQP